MFLLETRNNFKYWNITWKLKLPTLVLFFSLNIQSYHDNDSNKEVGEYEMSQKYKHYSKPLATGKVSLQSSLNIGPTVSLIKT